MMEELYTGYLALCLATNEILALPVDENADPNRDGDYAIIVIRDEDYDPAGWPQNGWTIYERIRMAGGPAQTKWVPVDDDQIMRYVADGYVVCDPHWVHLHTQVVDVEIDGEG